MNDLESVEFINNHPQVWVLMDSYDSVRGLYLNLEIAQEEALKMFRAPGHRSSATCRWLYNESSHTYRMEYLVEMWGTWLPHAMTIRLMEINTDSPL